MNDNHPQRKPKAAPECPFEKRFPSQLVKDETFYMSLAYNAALDAWKAGEVPIGAVIADETGRVIATAHNQVEQLCDPSAHAEMLAITQAARAVEDWRLNSCTLFVTKEPCPMCAGASIMARLGRVYYATPDANMGCLGGATSAHELPGLNHRVEVHQGVMQAECTQLIQTYFAMKRG